MISDTINTPADRKFSPSGVGLAHTFMCGCCGHKRPPLGRKLLRVQGLRTWVCASCAEGKR